MQAIILAGGHGTRLRPVVSDVPKPMAPVAGKPFLHWLLTYMQGQGVTEAVLCLHHQHDLIRDYFGNHFGPMQLLYSIEETPLGTGGALVRGLKLLAPEKPVLALNGDSLVALDYRKIYALHADIGARMSMAVRQVEDCHRYSELSVERGCVQQFRLLGGAHPGIISTGFYVISPDLFEHFPMPEAFSFERDFLSPYALLLKPGAYADVEYFIDIGIPMDYLRAQAEIGEWVKEHHEA